MFSINSTVDTLAVNLKGATMVHDDQKFGDRIRELREEKKMNDPEFSLRKFAVAIGISPTFLSKIEKNQFSPPTPERIIKMAELLEVDADELLAIADKVDPELSDIIKNQPAKEVADFLRTVRDVKLDAAQWKELTNKLRKYTD